MAVRPPRNEFEKRLDQALAALGMTNAEFAAAFGPNGQALVNGWKRRGKIGAETAARLRRGEVLPGFPIDWVNDGVGDPPKPGLRVQEERAAFAFTSQSQRPIPAILRATQEFLDRAFGASGKEFSLYEDAELFADVYEWIAEDDRPVDERNLVDFTQWRVKRDRRERDEQDRRITGQAGGSHRGRTA